MDLVKRDLINHLLDNYYEMDKLFLATKDASYEDVCLEIDRFLDYLGVDFFEIEGNQITGKMKDGTTFQSTH